MLVGDVGQEPGGVGLELLEEHAVAGDLAQRLTVGRAGDGDPDRAARAVPGEADDAHVVAEVLAPELGTDAGLLGELQHGSFELDVAEAVAQLGARRGQRVEVAGRGELGGLDGELGRRAADHDGQVVRRAGRRAERLDLLEDPRQQPLLVEQGLGLLVEVRLVGAAAALGHEQERVLVAVGGA